ncbi:hypothetical protein MHIB_41040 [Mycolicibacter hiberniae]|uniref:Acyl dehydratase n=1 Tax=Mycolicibacter hiberniae TaxID=29314 RepID=A0A7I7X7N3_9MYCO|nr:hypothetical protein MHIB_41040 [Mycolicibacter hiberniae]
MTGTGQITDEALERLRATIGIAVPNPQPPHYRRPNEDAFRHAAESYGDGNPLWCDPDYASKSVWGEPIAPPPLIGGDTVIGEDEVTELSEADRALTKGDPLRVYTPSTRHRRGNGGRRCEQDIASIGATPWWQHSTRPAISPSAPSTSGRRRSSATTREPSSEASTAT